MADKLYRITSFEGFMSLLVNKAERFVRPIDGWEDTFEGYHLHLLDTDEGAKRIIRVIYYEISGQDVKTTIANYSKMQRARYACYGQCWSLVEDSDAMWRIYSYGKKAVQLVSTRERIKNMITQSRWSGYKPRIEKVKYDLLSSGSSLTGVIKPGSKTDEPYFHKRIAFEHEKEMRVLLNDSKTYQSYTAFSVQAIATNLKKTDTTLPIEERILQASKKLDGKDNFYHRIFEKSITLKVDKLDEYLSGVRVHPQAEKWYVELIEKICSQYSIKFLGQSDLYCSAIEDVPDNGLLDRYDTQQLKDAI